jgi:hypothetical protein
LAAKTYHNSRKTSEQKLSRGAGRAELLASGAATSARLAARRAPFNSMFDISVVNSVEDLAV